jgi:hypothetical protein
MGYLLNNKPNQLVIAKVSLKSADILSSGFIYDIPEYPAVTGYYWQVNSMTGWINGGTIPYVGTSAVHIQSASAINPQFRFGGGYMQNINAWAFAPIIATINVKQFVPNDNLQIHNPVGLTIGDSDLTLYITAILIPF